jgi:hypothetical protein
LSLSGRCCQGVSFGGGGATMAEAPDEVIAAIRTAFAGVPRGAVTIHEAEVIDEYGSDAERAPARRLDTEASWDRVPDADIEACTTALCHLDPEGWRYYGPAYMVWSLRHYRVSNSIVSDFTIYTFDPSGDAGLREYKLARFRCRRPVVLSITHNFRSFLDRSRPVSL